jgi:site-specific recombinase XerD
LRYLINTDYPCPLSPEAVKSLKATQKQSEVAELNDLVRLIEAPAAESNIIELRDKVILETLFSTGLRVSELVSLNRDQVDLERHEFGVKGKGNKIRVVFYQTWPHNGLGVTCNRAETTSNRYLFDTVVR